MPRPGQALGPSARRRSHMRPTSSPNSAPADSTAPQPEPMCRHQPACPTAFSSDCEAAKTVATHPEQG
ncbi:DUF5999 family protein, partial [Streptomyces sp. ASQP_92]|uniref:DUF5999 family protein n=1 Tax=Streptomyces sp. ASQP_92 TaxID=2979116 RepID=UPI0037D9F956